MGPRMLWFFKMVLEYLESFFSTETLDQVLSHIRGI